jgi:hypothetical protein
MRHFKDWAILSDKRMCVTGREVSMQRGGVMWKRHWQHEDGVGGESSGYGSPGILSRRLKKRKASMGSGKPWIGGGEKESTLAVPTFFE